MSRAAEPHADQVAAWTGRSGAALMAHQEQLDRMLEPVARAGIALAGPRPGEPASGPDDPGPASFADTNRVARILTSAGFPAPDFHRLDLAFDLADSKGLEAAAQQAVDLGPTRLALEGQPEEARAAVIESVRTALQPHLRDGTVALPGSIWLVSST